MPTHPLSAFLSGLSGPLKRCYAIYLILILTIGLWDALTFGISLNPMAVTPAAFFYLMVRAFEWNAGCVISFPLCLFTAGLMIVMITDGFSRIRLMLLVFVPLLILEVPCWIHRHQQVGLQHIFVPAVIAALGLILARAVVAKCRAAA